MEKTSGLSLLRVPFEKHHISKLPKPYKKDSPKGNCKECGGYHGLPAMHLDYVGHAALTDRLLDADPNWSWEPVSMVDGEPKLDKSGGMWIKLTICGVTRLGYGDAQEKTGANAVKERIGDALRNAAMRFGAALDLWHKGDLHVEDEAAQAEPAIKLTGKHTPTGGVFEKLNPETQNRILDLATVIADFALAGAVDDAIITIDEAALEADEMVALKSRLDSKVRTAIQKELTRRKETQKENHVATQA